MTKELANSNELPSDQLCTSAGSERANSNELPCDKLCTNVGAESEEGKNILIEPGAFLRRKLRNCWEVKCSIEKAQQQRRQIRGNRA